MNVVRYKPWRPFGDLMSLQNKMNRLLSNSWYDEEEKDTDMQAATWYPVTDVFETTDGYVFRMEVPGIQKEDISIEFKDGSLMVRGERKSDTEVKQDDYHRVESYSGTFYRSFRLPETVDHQKIDASLKNGILRLTIAKAEEKKPKTIPIN